MKLSRYHNGVILVCHLCISVYQFVLLSYYVAIQLYFSYLIPVNFSFISRWQ